MKIEVRSTGGFSKRVEVLVNGHYVGLVSEVISIGGPRSDKVYTIVGQLGSRFASIEEAVDSLTEGYR